MVLDFSLNATIKQKPNAEDWEVAIYDFLAIWLDKSSTILVKTSGSTGLPKEIVVKKESMKQSAIATGIFLGLKRGDTALLCLPIEYIAGKMMLVRAEILGLKLICIKPTTAIALKEPVDFAAITPMQINQSLESLKLIKTVIIGGSVLDLDTKQKIQKIKKTQFYETYGMTETVSHIAMKNINAKEFFFTTLPNISISLDLKKCLVINAKFIDSKEIITNDLVEIIAKDKFILKGRIDNVINSGGIKISPEEVEQKLKEHIKSKFVVSSLLDKELGEKLVLIIEGEINIEVENKLKEVFSLVLSKYEKPKEIFYTKKIPTTNNGKILRKELKNSFNIAL